MKMVLFIYYKLIIYLKYVGYPVNKIDKVINSLIVSLNKHIIKSRSHSAFFVKLIYLKSLRTFDER